MSRILSYKLSPRITYKGSVRREFIKLEIFSLPGSSGKSALESQLNSQNEVMVIKIQEFPVFANISFCSCLV